MILTSAPRSSFFSATLVQTRLATPRSIPLHRPVLVTPQKRLIETTPASPPNPSQDLQIPDLASPLSAFSFPTHSFPLTFPPLAPPFSMPLPPSSRQTTRPSAALVMPPSLFDKPGSQAQQVKMPRRGPFHMFSTRFLTPPLATRFIFLRPTHVALANSLALVTRLTQRPRPRSDAISLRSDPDQLFFFALPPVAVAVNLVSFASV